MPIRRASRWIDIFSKFVQDARIASKEIVSTDARGVKLVLWNSQKRFLDNVAEGLDDGVRIFYALKSRQLGCTTISLLIDVFWLAMHKHLTMALVTDTEKNRDANRATLRQYVKSFPDGYFGDEFKIDKDNRSYMSFLNGSRIDFLVAGTKKGTISWAEGVGYAAAHLTEVSKYGDPEALASFEESFSQGNPNRLFMFESTANGFNHWRDRYLRGQADPITYRSFFLGWWSGDMNIIPRTDARFAQFGQHKPSGEERELVSAVAHLYGHRITDEQLAWIRWKEKNAAASEQDMLEQNQPWTENQAFVMTGYSFFQVREIGKDMKALLDGERMEPDGSKPWYSYYAYRYDLGDDIFSTRLKYLENKKENEHLFELKVWEMPKEEGRYVIGADPAYGRNENKDGHCAEVYRCFADRLVQVAEYVSSDVEAKHFAWVLAHLAGAYRDCIVNVEIGGPGRIIMLEWDHLRGLMQSEVYSEHVKSRDWENFLGQARWYLYNRPDSMGRGYANNFETTSRTKPEIMHQMRGAYATNELEIRSLGLFKEMRIVVQNGNEIGAPNSTNENSKDDRVIATALAVRAWINWRRPEMLAQGVTYEKVVKEEMGQVTPITRNLNQQVVRFFQTIEEREAERDARPPQTWRERMGIQ